MHIITLSDLDGRAVDRFGSVGFTIAPLGRLDAAHVAVARLSPGGVIGRHDAVGGQLLAGIEGSAVVSGADGVEHEIGPGRAAVWDAAENHETRTTTGVVALIIEGTWLDGSA